MKTKQNKKNRKNKHNKTIIRKKTKTNKKTRLIKKKKAKIIPNRKYRQWKLKSPKTINKSKIKKYDDALRNKN